MYFEHYDTVEDTVEQDNPGVLPDDDQLPKPLALSSGVEDMTGDQALAPMNEADEDFGSLEYTASTGAKVTDEAEDEDGDLEVAAYTAQEPLHGADNPSNLESDEPEPVTTEVGDEGRERGEHGESLGSEARRAYMRNGGFILFTAVGHEVMEQASHEVSPRPIAPEDVSSLPWDSQPSSTSGAVLGVVVNDLANQLEDMNGDRGDFNGDNPGTFYAEHDITAKDIAEQEGLSIHQHGFGDMEFTWHFAAAIANHVVAEGERQGDITAEERADMTLGDWANIIEAPWFSAVIHDLALTDNGKYGSLGRFPSDYNYEKVNGLPPFNHVDNSFGVEVSRDSQTQHPQISSARLNDQLRAHLRAGMKTNASSGCPVARHHGVLPTDRIANDPHAQSLIATGRLKTTDTGNDKTSFEQEQTPIDTGLRVLAGHLRDYDTRFGTPRYLVASGRTTPTG